MIRIKNQNSVKLTQRQILNTAIIMYTYICSIQMGLREKGQVMMF